MPLPLGTSAMAAAPLASHCDLNKFTDVILGPARPAVTGNRPATGPLPDGCLRDARRKRGDPGGYRAWPYVPVDHVPACWAAALLTRGGR